MWNKKVVVRVPFVNILSDEVLLNIFTHLNAQELCKASRVCKKMKMFTAEESLWKNLILNNNHEGYYFPKFHLSNILDNCHIFFKSRVSMPVNILTSLILAKHFPYMQVYLPASLIRLTRKDNSCCLIFKNPKTEYTIYCVTFMHECQKKLGYPGIVQEFYFDVKKKIPKREFEKGLEIGGFFFNKQNVDVIVEIFNTCFTNSLQQK